MPDFVNDIHAFDHLSEAGMYTIKVLCIHAVVADEELAAAGVFASMCHGEDTAVVPLARGRGLALDLPARTTGTHTWVAWGAAERTASLNDEIRNNTMEAESVIKTRFGQFDEVRHSIGNIFLI